MHHCRPKVMSPIVYPTKCCNVNTVEKIIVPHIHPSHTNFHHQQIIENVHCFPHTTSQTTGVTQYNVIAGCPPGPMGMTGPFGSTPGPGFGPMPGSMGPRR